jgi:hypothetical protein
MILERSISSRVSTAPATPLVARVEKASSLSVVIPALNEEGSIAEIVQRVDAVRAELQQVGINELEIIVVDDGSDDRTAEIVSGFPYVRLLRHPVNRGYGAAIKSGFSQARGDLLSFLDADGTYPPEHFPLLCQVAVSQPVDLVVGSRRSGTNSHMPPLRRVGNFIWSNLVSLTGSKRVADPASGMRVLRRSSLSKLYPLPDGLNFTPVMTTRAVHESLSMVEIPIPYDERVGRSKLSIVRDGTRFLTTILWTALEYNPVRILGSIGLLALALASLICMALIALRLQGVTTLGPWGVFSLFSALVLAVGGISTYCLGATFNYLVALFHRDVAPQGMFVTPIFPPLDHHFGLLGLLALLGGGVLAGVSLVLGVNGWEIARLWFWLLTSALVLLVGVQLLISWILMRVLETLSERSGRVEAEMIAFEG